LLRLPKILLTEGEDVVVPVATAFVVTAEAFLPLLFFFVKSLLLLFFLAPLLLLFFSCNFPLVFFLLFPLF